MISQSLGFSESFCLCLCLCLCLSFVSANRLALVEAGAIDSIITALNTFGNRPEVVVAALDALSQVYARAMRFRYDFHDCYPKPKRGQSR